MHVQIVYCHPLPNSYNRALLDALSAGLQEAGHRVTVTDLYRDVLNIFGYIPRVVQHWHKHRIWQLR